VFSLIVWEFKKEEIEIKNIKVRFFIFLNM
jgi:hypothetical protein